MSKTKVYEVVYTWTSGRDEIRYRRSIKDLTLAIEVRDLRRTARRKGHKSPYSVRRGD